MKKEILDKIIQRKNYKKNLKTIVKNEKECEEILKYIYRQYGIEYK